MGQSKRLTATVITTISPPNGSIRAAVDFALANGGIAIVVGDKKTPGDAYADFNGIYLSPDEQLRRWPLLAALIPWNSYARKNFGYLLAVELGADIIVETDDDNMPLSGFGEIPIGEISSVSSDASKWFNPYWHFSATFMSAGHRIWPRGFPLEHIGSKHLKSLVKKSAVDVAVWQGLTDGDPDVDAIYRLTSNIQINYSETEPIAIEKYTWCPFNSQNTIWTRPVFDCLYLPVGVGFRFTDILRSFVAQQQFWERRLRLGYTGPTTTSKRNPHDLLHDFADEIAMYQNCSRIATALSNDCGDIMSSYATIEALGVAKDERRVVDAWLRALEKNK